MSNLFLKTQIERNTIEKNNNIYPNHQVSSITIQISNEPFVSGNTPTGSLLQSVNLSPKGFLQQDWKSSPSRTWSAKPKAFWSWDYLQRTTLQVSISSHIISVFVLSLYLWRCYLTKQEPIQELFNYSLKISWLVIMF